MPRKPSIVPAGVAEFVNGLRPSTREVVQALRRVVLCVAPDSRETVLWGGLSYHRPDVGGRIKGAICQISAKSDRVRLEFIHGVRLTDPRRLLEGDRVSKRYVPVADVRRANDPDLAALVRQAASLIPARGPLHVSSPSKSKAK